jgi:hypothetical protein
MKTSTSTQNKPMVPSLFQIASHFEDFVPAAGLKRPATASSNTPFADLMQHPEKLKAALNSARIENDAFAAQQARSGSPAKPATRSATSNKCGGNGAGKPAGDSPGNPRKIEFVLEAPSARSVKLVADFTDWEKFPHEMMRFENGEWFSVIWLAPGQYSYRFIVDGQWCDDPCATQRVPNPFGTENALRVVA